MSSVRSAECQLFMARSAQPQGESRAEDQNRGELQFAAFASDKVGRMRAAVHLRFQGGATPSSRNDGPRTGARERVDTSRY
jgi:hypothetical protein